LFSLLYTTVHVIINELLITLNLIYLTQTLQYIVLHTVFTVHTCSMGCHPIQLTVVKTTYANATCGCAGRPAAHYNKVARDQTYVYTTHLQY
jgi:hypothetical protein